jgi:hypothetical protein
MNRTKPRWEAFEREAAAARAAYSDCDLDRAFALLERAHILGQPWAGAHNWTHWMMLKIGWRRADMREVRGQLIRLAAGGFLSLVGKLPTGNTGGANVSATNPLPGAVSRDATGLRGDRRATYG